MELSAWITLAVLAVMIVALYTERVPPAPAVLGAVVVLMLIGVIEPEQAFAGFSKEDRDTNILRIGWVCEVLSRNDVVAIGAA
ncbi:MAG TPA: SLC13 family permease, partial [Candidatus Limnocylindria bacterium]|nr:SLC13 family permease [Candidatus Limnocylindria bacterium]